MVEDPKYDLSRKGKRKASDVDVDGDANASATPKKKRNKQRVLLLSSRGITHRMRHLMNDLEALLPHVKKGVLCKLCVVFVSMLTGALQIRSSIRRTTSTCCPSSRIYIRVTTLFTLRRVGTRTCTSGQPRHRTGQASSYICKMSTRWTSSR